jgi:hypothetical protein
VAAGRIRHAGRKLEIHVLGFKCKINFRMHRATDDMIYRKGKVKTVSLVECRGTGKDKITSRNCEVY